MDNIAIEIGKKIYRDRYKKNPQIRTHSEAVTASGIVNIGNPNEIAMLYDISENDVDFTIESDTAYVENSTYFRNAVPVVPVELAGNVIIKNTGTKTNTFTLIVFYQ